MRVAPPSPTSSPDPLVIDRRRVRARLRALRLAIRPAYARRAALLIAHHAQRAGLLRPGTRVGAYIAMPGEMPTRPLIDAARASACEIYLPRILDLRSRRMQFLRWRPRDVLLRHRYGLSQPERSRSRAIPPRRLDVVFVPLLGVDASGTRIGMGAGFYDRHFAFRLRSSAWRRPRLIGIAYDLQRVDRLERAPWDVPLDGILTESGMHRSRAFTHQR
jgi:5-formyltetrahydrofolate cyclo-ligase